MIEPASTLDMDDDTRGRMITRCVAYMTQRKIPIRDTRAVTRLLASNWPTGRRSIPVEPSNP